MRFEVIKLISALLLFFVLKSLSSENINLCIKDAVKVNVELNKILTMCRENIKNIEVYNNSYSKNIPVLEDDTKNIIEYVEQSSTKKNKKFNFWKLLETNE